MPLNGFFPNVPVPPPHVVQWRGALAAEIVAADQGGRAARPPFVLCARAVESARWGARMYGEMDAT